MARVVDYRSAVLPAEFRRASRSSPFFPASLIDERRIPRRMAETEIL